MQPTADADRFAIRELVENWALWRDAGDWERFTVKTGLPGLTGEAVMRLYDEGAGWLHGSPAPGEPR